MRLLQGNLRPWWFWVRWGVWPVVLTVILACNVVVDWGNWNPLPPTATPVPTPMALPQAQVTFEVTVPAGTPPDAQIVLSLLDEVTGLALNARDYPMEPQGGGVYRVRVPLGVHSVVKYRYKRVLGQGTVVEYRTDGLPVRYRLLRVDGEMLVRDLVARWGDAPFGGSTGRIVGQVRDAVSGVPLVDVLVTAGGQHTFTHADGSFILEGVPAGLHNLVAYDLDQRYTIFQQLAEVAAGAATPAEIRLAPRPLVPVTFEVTVPPDTIPNAPVRLAGNLYSLGNTFGDLPGGMSVLASRMPTLQPVPDQPQHYTLTLSLPAGAYVRYKYTLGDGFWNAEHDADGRFVTRELIVPFEGGTVHDFVTTWQVGDTARAWLEVQTPANTPPSDWVDVQLAPQPGLWTAPLPLWPLGEGRWGYAFYGPIDVAQELLYRYCRNEACAAATEAVYYGPQGGGRVLLSSLTPQNHKDQVNGWAWYQGAESSPQVVVEEVQPRQDFVNGLAVAPLYDPTWNARWPQAAQALVSLQPQWVFLTPTWSVTRVNLPVFEPLPGYDPLQRDVETMAEGVRAVGVEVALFPMLRFPGPATVWWAQAERSFGWWNSWWDRYTTFALHHADTAQRIGARALVLGGPWVTPALPGGTLADGSPSAVPADAEQRWRALFQAVRARFNGQVVWALPEEQALHAPPPFLDAVDVVLVLWSPALVDDPQADLEALRQATARRLDDLRPWAEALGKPVWLAPAYPAADGGTTACVAYRDRCLSLADLRPGQAPPDLRVDLEEQVRAYNAFFLAVNQAAWVRGVVVREFYPMVMLQDPSASLYGKPAAGVVWYWFQAWRQQP